VRIIFSIALLAVGCGSAVADEESASHAQAVCDYCPGAASVRTQTFSGGEVMMYCKCASSPNPPGVFDTLEFEINPPIARCSHTQCVFAGLCSTGNLPDLAACPP
jgi:hypothetical protein